MIKKGLCQCGCGQKTSIAKQSNLQRGYIKGQPVKCILGHRIKNYVGSNNPSWRGGKHTRRDGYIFIWKPNHPRSNSKGYVMEHILIAEKAFGKPLPIKAHIHHVNEITSDNRKENLVICENNAYHLFLHQRIRALKACDHANWRICMKCSQYDEPQNLHIYKTNAIHHQKNKKCIKTERISK